MSNESRESLEQGIKLHQQALPHIKDPGALRMATERLEEMKRELAKLERDPSGHDVLEDVLPNPNDRALIRMMATSSFGPKATVVLPSGKSLTGAEMTALIALLEDEGVAQ